MPRLTGVSGTVLVDHGDGFAPVGSDSKLELGDRVMVTDGGQASLDFGNNCVLPLAAPSVTTVAETACTSSTQGNNGSAFIPLALLGAATAGGLIWYFTKQNNGGGNNNGVQLSP